MKNISVTPEEFQQLLVACAELPFLHQPRAKTDYVVDVMQTVLDFHMQAPVVFNALAYFREHVQPQHGICTHAQLEAVLSGFPDTLEGNKAASQFLWGNAHWKRIELLRLLLPFLTSINITDQPSLYAWAEQADFERDFKARVKGLGLAVFHWLLIRCGISSIKPDVWVINFGKRVLGKRVAEAKLIEAFRGISLLIGEPLATLDVTIWYYEKMAMAATDVPALRIAWWHMLKDELGSRMKDALPGVAWQLALDAKALLRYDEAGLTMTPSFPLLGKENSGMTTLAVRQSLWSEGLALTLQLTHETALPTMVLEQFKARLEAYGWEVGNEPVFVASLDLDSELLTTPETTLDEMAEWASEISQCVVEAVTAAEFETYNQT